MPRAAVELAVGKRGSERAMSLAAAVDRRLAVDRGARERVPELRAPLREADETRGLGGIQAGEVEAERGGCAREDRRLARVVRGDQHEESPRVLVERLRAP